MLEQAFVNGVVLSANYALLALGITLIFSVMNILNFAHGQLFMIGGFMVYYACATYGLPYFVGLLVAVVVTGAIGVLFQIFLFKRVMRIATREENAMLLAVGTALLLENAAYSIFGEKERAIPPVVKGVLRIGSAFLPANRLFVVGISVALIGALFAFLYLTRTGRAMRALAQDREATLLMGVHVERISALGFGIGAALAGIAGGLLVSVVGVNAGVGTSVSIKAFIMIMVGGAGLLSGAVLGAIVLGFAEAFGYVLLPGSLTYLMIFIGLIVLLLVRPQGLLGKPWG